MKRGYIMIIIIIIMRNAQRVSGAHTHAISIAYVSVASPQHTQHTNENAPLSRF